MIEGLKLRKFDLEKKRKVIIKNNSSTHLAVISLSENLGELEVLRRDLLLGGLQLGLFNDLEENERSSFPDRERGERRRRKKRTMAYHGGSLPLVVIHGLLEVLEPALPLIRAAALEGLEGGEVSGFLSQIDFAGK